MSVLSGLFDSHAHFATATAADVLRRAREADMAGVVAVGADASANDGALAAQAADPGFVRLALGFDYSSGETPMGARRFLAPYAERGALAAVGEIGLDAHYGRPEDAPAQRALFEEEVALAAEWGLPVIVHCRETEEAVLAGLRSHGSATLRSEGRLGVLHCFVGDTAFARAVLELGMMVSLSGIVTFRNADALRAVARTIPLDRLLVETDSPYLAPVPLRGKTNEPAFVEHTVRCLAEVRGEPLETLVAATAANARRLFRTL